MIVFCPDVKRVGGGSRSKTSLHQGTLRQDYEDRGDGWIATWKIRQEGPRASWSSLELCTYDSKLYLKE